MNRKILFVLIALCVGAGMFAMRFGRDLPIPFAGNSKLCPTLKEIPFGEDTGLIKRVTRISIEGIKAAYCPSFVRDEKGLFLVFRHDEKQRKEIFGIKTLFRGKIPFGSVLKMPYRTYISSVRLNEQFQPISKPKRVFTGSDFSEDPRVFKMEDQVYLVYNDIERNDMESRTIHLAKLDPETLKISDHVNLDLNFRRIEKNWAPFVYEEKGEKKIHFGYYFNPHVILKMNDPTQSELIHLRQPNHIAVQRMPWKQSFGIVRGGTPPILVDGQYLAFFHSFFQESGKIWYVMGAYTFEAAPPFRITGCSPQPIQFKGIYDTKTCNTAFSKKPNIFPAGAILAQEDGRDVIHVSCGENDSAIKVITFDKEALLASLAPVPYLKKK